MFRKNFSIILSVILIFSLNGCNKSNKQGNQQMATQESQSNDAPQQLKDIEKGLEKIFKSLDGPVGMNIQEDQDSKQNAKKESKPKSSPGAENKSGSEGGGSQSSDKGSSGGGQGGGSSEKQDQQQQQQPAKTDPWQEASKSIQELHTLWDEYAPKSMKDGASKELTDSFGNSLNELTMVALKKDGLTTMVATNKVYGYIADFYYLYKTKTSPEIKKVKFYARDAIISSAKTNWEQTDSDIKNLKTSFSVFKRSLDDKMKDKGTKIENSIYELEKVEKERNKELTDIKGRLVLKGTMDLEKELDEAKKK